ncbi:MAG: hypothetical protein KKH54_03240, partial [Alphaproteobacteria bacterium]|nr:hypothetical protein [Alphaproteobacteria bacterium]
MASLSAKQLVTTNKPLKNSRYDGKTPEAPFGCILVNRTKLDQGLINCFRFTAGPHNSAPGYLARRAFAAINPDLMDRIIIRGGKVLNGRLPISGAKNAALTLLPCALLTDEPVTL